MQSPKEWFDQLALIAGAIGSSTMTAVALHRIFKWIVSRNTSWRSWRRTREARRLSFESLPAQMQQVSADLVALREVVDRIHHQTYPNGGNSLFDKVKFLEYRDQMNFQFARKPAFRCDARAHFTHVTNAFCKLVEIIGEKDLLGLSWRRFLGGDAETARDLIADLLTSLSSQSSHVLHSPMQSISGTPVGSWRFSFYYAQQLNGKDLWEGYLTPDDEIARKIAEQQHWNFD